MKSNIVFLIAIVSIFWIQSGFTSGVESSASEIKHGDTFDMSRYKGKIIVVHYWASWSKASRAENKNLNRIYTVYKNNPKVVFVSISLDTDEATWKQAIDEDELIWKDHFCDFKKYESPMVTRYAVTTIPKFLVFNSKGVQVHNAANAHDLEAVIKGQL